MRNLIRVLSLSLALTAAALLGSLFVQTGWSQQVTRSIQLSQDPTGFLGADFAFKHVHAVTGAAPVPTATGGTVVGTDTAFQLTATATSGSVTFANPFPTGTFPRCVLAGQSAPLYTVTNTAITIATMVNTNVYYGICLGG
jgi:hypothetical protein